MKYRDLERSIQWMEIISKDDSHGYSMSSRYSPNFDCSSFISFALIFGGFKVRHDSVTWNLHSQLRADGWKDIDINAPRQRGDIFLSEHGGSGGGHVIACVDASKMVHASSTSKGILIEDFYIPSFGYDFHMRYDGYNEPSTGSKKSNEEIAREVIAGKWSVYPERKKLLEKAGYNYKEIQTLVNKILKGK